MGVTRRGKSTAQLRLAMWDKDFNAAFDMNGDTGELADFLAKSALKNNQLADILMGAAERMHDADWRSKQLVETF